MRLSFDEDEEEAYFATREDLLDEVEAALRSAGRPDEAAEVAGSISILLDWRWNYSSGRLDEWAIPDVDEFLLDWLPRKYSAPPEAGAEVCAAVAEFFVHMGARGRLVGGTERAAALVARAYALTDDVVEAMGDPSNFGLAKSMFTAGTTEGVENPLAVIGELLDSGVDAEDPEVRTFLLERMDAFNALPFEQRRAITDGTLAGPPPAVHRIRIPVVDIPPTLEEVEQSAARSRLIRMVDTLVDDVGAKGIGVTQAGNLRLVDAKRLVDLLGTDDEWERTVPWSDVADPVRSSTELTQLTLVFDTAEDAGVFTRLKTKIKVDPAWLDQPWLERAHGIVDAFLARGPISSQQRFEFPFQVAALIEDGLPHWLSMALPEGAAVEIEPLVEQAAEVVESTLPRRPRAWEHPDSLSDLVGDHVFDAIGALDFAGVIEWGDRREVEGKYGRRERGGWFRLTPLGRHTLIPYIRAAGYDFPTLTDLAAADAEDLVNVALTTDVDPEHLLSRWRPEWSAAERAAALAGFAMVAESAHQRVETMALLGMIEPVAATGPAVRQMLDSKCAGHAALFLLERGLATDDEVGAFLDIAPLVDLLASLTDSPDLLVELFTEAAAAADSDLLEDLWRHDQPETIDLLEALGAHLPDKRLAKSARKAALRHRSWMANRSQ